MSRFFSARWNGLTPLGTLLWRDMLVVGTLINIAASFMALAALALDVHAGIAVAIHFVPLPYNVFLLAALLRRPDAGAATTAVAAVWFVGCLII